MTFDATAARAKARTEFLSSHGLGGAVLDALPADASFRRYFRLMASQPPMLLMDAPPPKEDVRPFIRVARHLTGLGLSAPRIYEADVAHGFALIEDFGAGTYTRLLDSGADPEPLYRAATDALVVLHTHPDATAIDLSSYDRTRMLNEASELPDWYGLAIQGPVPDDARENFIGLWGDLLAGLPPPENGVVLLDYHVDNLMRLEGRQGAAACGLLDFQDAVMGPKAYDLLCLLRNERRGMDPALSAALYAHYLAACPPADPDAFGVWYRVLAAQRYTKVVGRFARLTLRDGRDGYLKYLPRVLGLLSDALDGEPLLHAIRAQLNAMLPDWRTPPVDDPNALRARLAYAKARP